MSTKPARKDKADRIRLGVSSCLLGQQVRYDGGHKHDRYLTDILARYFELVPVCPEVEVGMGTPRETVRLEGALDAPRMIAPGSGKDWTNRMNTWSRQRARELAADELSGYIFKKNSPSCGIFRVKVVKPGKASQPKGRGLFAAEFMRRHPLVPVEEEGRLHDARLRENFIERIFAYDRLKQAFAGRWPRGRIVAFHSREKYLLLAHSPRHYQELGRLVARIADHKPTEFRDRYMATYQTALAIPATTRRHVNALLHLAGHLRGHISPAARNHCLAVIDEFGGGLVPLVVPMTLLRHYIELHEVPYVRDQLYLNPHPKELMLRNHV